MFHEMMKGKPIDGVETSPLNKKEIEEASKRLEENLDKISGLSQDRYPEVPVRKAFEFTEVKEPKKTTEILKPDIESIKSQSLMAIKQGNIEKVQESTQVNETSEYRVLDEEEVQKLREQTHLSESAIQSIVVDKDGTYYLKCINEAMAGQANEITGVKYVEKNITIDGVEITAVVPEFSYVLETSIPEEVWLEGDNKVFKFCTEQLRDYLEVHPEIKSQFSVQQLAQIEKILPRISGYTWHHTEIPGKMQLVDSKVHADTRHTGGNHIWCGGVR